MYRSILVPFDGSDTSARGLREAVRLGQCGGARIVLLHAIEDFPSLREFVTEHDLDVARTRRRQTAVAMLDDAAHAPQAAHVPVDTTVLFTRETVPQAIVDFARERHCDLVVLGTHGRSGVARALLGSVAEGVARLADVPVLLVPPASPGEARYG